MSAKVIRLVPTKPRLQEVLAALDYAHQSELVLVARIQELVEALGEIAAFDAVAMADAIGTDAAFNQISDIARTALANAKGEA